MTHTTALAGAPMDRLDRLANDVHNTTQAFWTYRHTNRIASINDWLTTHQTFSTIHGNTANAVFTKMFLSFKYQFITIFTSDFECIVDLGQLFVAFKLHVDYGTNDLFDLTNVGHIRSKFLKGDYTPAACRGR